MCVGNGETAKRVTEDGIGDVACASPDGCAMAKAGGCKPYGRLNVAIEGQEEELSSFVFRTTGFNSIRTLTARLQYFEAVSGGNTRYLPLQLKLRAKSTTQSHRAPVYYVDLGLRDGLRLEDAVSQAVARQEFGIDLSEEVAIQVANFGPQLQAATGEKLWRDGRIKRRRDVHVVRHRDLDTAIG